MRRHLHVALQLCGCMSVAMASPTIEITNTPAFGSFADLQGHVLDADPTMYRVAVFIYVPSAGWWSKPYCDPALTTIESDGRWATDVTTGGVDEFATRLTALLVSSDYGEPCVEGLPTLPTNVLGQAIASDTVVRVDPAVRRITFSDHSWWVKNSPGLVGPGPNRFSDSTDNVWTDLAGRLHLRITNRSNEWQCAEVITERSFGYGSYRFELESVVDDLDPHVVLGLFTWSDDPAFSHREIDVECGRWADSNDVNNAQFVVQPWYLPGHLARYTVPAGISNSTHLFTWDPDGIHFESQVGSFSPSPLASNVLARHGFTNAAAVPEEGNENVRLNLWLINGAPPTDNTEVEIVIGSFQFVPLGTAQPARLSDPQLDAFNQVQFTIQGIRDRRYLIDRSSNAVDWQALDTLLATNSHTLFIDTNEEAGRSRRFYRATTLP